MKPNSAHDDTEYDNIINIEVSLTTGKSKSIVKMKRELMWKCFALLWWATGKI